MDFGMTPGSFHGRWEAKKARALARRKEQSQLTSGGPSRRISQPPGGSSSLRLGGSAVLRGLPERPESETPEYTARDFAAMIDQKMDRFQDQRRTYDEPPKQSYSQSANYYQERQALALSKPATSSNVWANQNTGNFITDRPTSRVLNPPGGRSSISFG